MEEQRNIQKSTEMYQKVPKSKKKNIRTKQIPHFYTTWDHMRPFETIWNQLVPSKTI